MEGTSELGFVFSVVCALETAYPPVHQTIKSLAREISNLSVKLFPDLDTFARNLGNLKQALTTMRRKLEDTKQKTQEGGRLEKTEPLGAVSLKSIQTI